MMIPNEKALQLDQDKRVAIAKRYFGVRASGSKVDCWERVDGMWEMLKLIPDPTLEKDQLEELKNRKIPVPYRWVTIDVVEPYVVTGIEKSIANSKVEIKDGIN